MAELSLSGVMCQVSHVKVVKLFDGGSVINGALVLFLLGH